MGTYLNPGNEGFQEILQSEYVDKTGLSWKKSLGGTGVSQKWIELVSRSRKLLEDTIAGNAEAVAWAVEEIRGMQYAPTFYNDGQALRYVIKYAYMAARL